MSRLDYAFDLENGKIIHADDLEQHDKIGKFTAAKGGILSDEMGLGKTIESTYDHLEIFLHMRSTYFFCSSRVSPRESSSRKYSGIH